MGAGAKFGAFALISGIGFGLDVALTLGLVWAGLPAFWANMAGALLGVSFVFFAALHRVFRARDRFQWRLFGAYLIWQALAIPAASAAIGLLASAAAGLGAWGEGVLEAVLPVALVPPGPVLAAGLAKAAVTPATLYANYRFMDWLLKGQSPLKADVRELL
ncbi:MAG: GtrA family protein [Pseudomonadota bacterium]